RPAAHPIPAEACENEHSRYGQNEKPLKLLEDIGYLSQGRRQLNRVGISGYFKLGGHDPQRNAANNPGFVSQRALSFTRLWYVVIATRGGSKDPGSLCIAYL